MEGDYFDLAMCAYPGDSVASPAKVAARFAVLEKKIADLERRLDRMDEYQQEQNEQS
jgi:hypothetical protein